jgi:hypothetical protein
LDEGGREEPRHKTDWALEVHDDGDHGGDPANNIEVPSVGCRRYMMVILPPMLVLGVRKAPRREGSWESEDGGDVQCDDGDVRGDIPSLSGQRLPMVEALPKIEAMV